VINEYLTAFEALRGKMGNLAQQENSP
jgi:hypothetical protein